MITKKDCNNCGKKFDAKRANALYCSDSCKTQAHTKRTAKKIEDSEPKERLVFYLDEFNSVSGTSEWAYNERDERYYSDLDLPMFCFLRNKYPKKATPSINNLEAYFYPFADGRGLFSRPRMSDAFKDFEKRFYNDEFELLESKEPPQQIITES